MKGIVRCSARVIDLAGTSKCKFVARYWVQTPYGVRAMCGTHVRHVQPWPFWRLELGKDRTTTAAGATPSSTAAESAS